MSYPPGPPQAVTQHCYRHADRPAGVTCQRCNRPICPSCMVTASVGFQCPECARQGAKQQRLVDVFHAQSTPYVTYVLIAINVAVFLIGSRIAGFQDRFAVTARPFGETTTGQVVVIGKGVADGEWWRIITGGFLHADIIHLGMNMYVLYLIGGAMERVVGRARFAVVYVVSLIGGSVGALLLDPHASTVGASGAIFGLFAVLACLDLSRGRNPMKGGIGPTILLNLAITLVFSGALGDVGGFGLRISAGGHVGGLIAGGICGAMLFGLTPSQARTVQSKQQIMQVLVVVLGLLLFAGAVGVGYARA